MVHIIEPDRPAYFGSGIDSAFSLHQSRETSFAISLYWIATPSPNHRDRIGTGQPKVLSWAPAKLHLKKLSVRTTPPQACGLGKKTPPYIFFRINCCIFFPGLCKGGDLNSLFIWPKSSGGEHIPMGKMIEWIRYISLAFSIEKKC